LFLVGLPDAFCLENIEHAGIGVIGFIGQEELGLNIGKKRVCTLQITGLPLSEMKACRIAQRIARSVDFGAQSTFTAPDCLALPLFF
jgi:hypothetical protein